MDENKLVWMEDRFFAMTSVIIWNDQFRPYQALLFKETYLDDIVVKMFTRVEGQVYYDELVQENYETKPEEQIEYEIFQSALAFLNLYTLTDKVNQKIYHQDDLQNANRYQASLCSTILLNEEEVNKYQLIMPEHEFYSLAPNFLKVKKAIEDISNMSLVLDFWALSIKFNTGGSR